MLGQDAFGISITYLIGLVMLAIAVVIGLLWSRKDPSEVKKYGWSTSVVAKIAILAAVAAAGGFITIPGPATSIRLDSLAGYFGALMFGWEVGAIIAAFGTFFSNFMSGFSGWAPMVPYYMMCMAFTVVIYGFVSKRLNRVVGIVVGTIANTLCILPWYLMLGWGLFITILPAQVLGSFVNAFLGSIAYTAITQARKRRKKEVNVEEVEPDQKQAEVGK